MRKHRLRPINPNNNKPNDSKKWNNAANSRLNKNSNNTKKSNSDNCNKLNKNTINSKRSWSKDSTKNVRSRKSRQSKTNRQNRKSLTSRTTENKAISILSGGRSRNVERPAPFFAYRALAFSLLKPGSVFLV